MTGIHRARRGFSDPFSMRASLDMYTEGGQGRRFLQPNGVAGPCACRHHGDGPGYQAASATHPDHPHLAGHGDSQPLRVKDAGGRAFRGGPCSAQRQPVLLGPGPFSQSQDLARLGPPWELKPAQWSRSSELGTRHCQFFRERCECVAASNHSRAHPFHVRIPHPLPHLRVNGHACGYTSRSVHQNVLVDKGEDASTCVKQNGHLEHPFATTNGHCAPKQRRDIRQDSGGSGENCNGRHHKGFFPTEVPQKHFDRDKRKEVCIRSPAVVDPEAPITDQATNQASRQDLVKDQIRQVVTDLEDVLGGLKQVHVEMKEVIERIDHLTASMDLNEDPRNVACGSTGDAHTSAHPGEPAVSHPAERSRRSDEERVILTTNSPSPVHTASVVKTRCFTPPTRTNHLKHTNGHPPLIFSDHKADNPESRWQHLNPQVVIGNSTTLRSRTQKPPLYPPHNGICGKATRTPAYVWRSRHNNSML